MVVRSVRGTLARIAEVALVVSLADAALAQPAPAQELFRSSTPLPAELTTASGCAAFRGVDIEWAELKGASEGERVGLLVLGSVRALRFSLPDLRPLTPVDVEAPKLAVQRVSADRVLIDFRMEIDYQCVVDLKGYPLERQAEPATAIQQALLVEDMGLAISKAEVARERQDHLSAARSYARANEIRRQLGLAGDSISIQIDKQRIQSWALGGLPVDVAEAQELVDTATRQLGPTHDFTANATTALANTLDAHGRYSEAVAVYRKALELTIATQGSAFRATWRLQQALASTLFVSGQRREALTRMENSYQQIAREQGPEHVDTWYALLLLIPLYSDLGRFDEAEQFARQALQFFRQHDGSESRGALSAQRQLVRVLMETGRLDEAEPLVRMDVSVRIRLDGAANDNTLRSINQLAELYLRMGRPAAADDVLKQAFAAQTTQTAQAAPSLAATRQLQARFLASTGQVDEARSLYETQLAEADQQQGPSSSRALGLRFALAELRSLDDLESAAALYDQGITILERLRAEGGVSIESRQQLLARYADQYRKAAWIAVKRGRADEVLRLSELSKARTLLDSLTLRDAETSAGLPSEERTRIVDLAGRINALQGQAITARDDVVRRADLESRKNILVRELDDLRDSLRAKWPKFKRLSEVKIIERADEMRDALPKGLAFVSYVFVQEGGVHTAPRQRLIALVVRQGEPVAAIDLGAADDAASLVERYRRAIEDDRGSSAVERAESAREISTAAAAMSARWLAPLEPYLRDRRRIVIAPDGVLATLPFEGLPWGGSGEKRLVDEFEISYSQSLSIFALMASRPTVHAHSRAHELFAMGAPDFASLGGSTALLQASALPPTESLRRASRKLGESWAPLPGALNEVRAVAALFDKRGSSVLVGAEATEDRLDAMNRSGALAQYRYLHFATHGVLNIEQPALSAVVLGRSGPDSGYDGYVTALEWLGYGLRSDLIVLSACSTGEGTIVKGEGVLGLPFALFVAGNRNTLLSLWPVPDAATSAFMVRFFGKLRGGQSQSAALAATKREFRRDPRYGDPVNWAGFVLYGS